MSDETWPRTYETTLVGRVRERLTADPVHMRCIGDVIDLAATELEREWFMRCICRDVDCCMNQIELRAWHIAWARWARFRLVVPREPAWSPYQ